MDQKHIRNVAIIAHVDHGKTTLVDQLFKQSGLYRENQHVEERLMDSMDLEKERGITIMAKNGACFVDGYTVNIIDTPGHADFGGEVERVLHMADGAVFLVDAAEGPMPQSYFVLKKAIRQNIPVIVVVNKIDKPNARIEWVQDQVFDLMVKLNAPDHILDFPIVYASAKNGYASLDPDSREGDMKPLFNTIINRVPPPHGDPNGPFQLLVRSISYSSFLGRLAIGKITNGSLVENQMAVLATPEEVFRSARITKIYRYEGSKQIETKAAICGDIIAVAGLEDVQVGQTLTDPTHPIPLAGVLIDPPTVSINILPNDSPFAGREGQFVTSRQVRDRLLKETLSDVALKVEIIEGELGYKVSGRGELHLSILIEKMRREGYEFQVSAPSVIFKTEGGQKLEPYEELTIDVAKEYMGSIIESLGIRKGQMIEVIEAGDVVRLIYKIPTRGLLGYQSQFLTETKGMGTLNYVFAEYGPYSGDIRTRKTGVLIAKENCTTIAYGLNGLQDRGVLFMGPAEEVYEGQIIGEHSREDDLVVNPGKGKKLTNMRASGSDDNVMLTPPVKMSLEKCLSYIDDTELIEVTPKSIRLRKLYRNENERKRMGRN